MNADGTSMNIFVLDTDIALCAQYHCDQHVIKMIVESAQLLCTALNKKGFCAPYRSTHMKHPCVYWVEESYDNFQWLAALGLALHDEYQYRFDAKREHASAAIIREVRQFRYESRGLTEFAQAMPDQYKVPGDPVAAYRNFYKGEKARFARWTKREKPWWM